MNEPVCASLIMSMPMMVCVSFALRMTTMNGRVAFFVVVALVGWFPTVGGYCSNAYKNEAWFQQSFPTGNAKPCQSCETSCSSMTDISGWVHDSCNFGCVFFFGMTYHSDGGIIGGTHNRNVGGSPTGGPARSVASCKAYCVRPR